MRVILCASIALAAVGCGGDDTVSCDGFRVPTRRSTSDCEPVGSDPRGLVHCEKGSGYAGQWSIDTDGLPVYELSVEERCDPAGQHDSALGRGPVHLIGNGRGVMALAHASGAVELYSEERGHKWINHVDLWSDPEDPDAPRQVGGGWSYVTSKNGITSTRHADLAIGGSADEQVRRFGVGYVETVTRGNDVVVRRRVFAPDNDVRALIAEVSVSNLSESRQSVGLVELWDVNLHQLVLAFEDDVSPSNLEAIQRRRRALQGDFTHVADYSAEARTAKVTSAVRELPPTVATSADRSDVDYFIDPVFLATVDQGTAPEAVWLTDGEIWPDDPRRQMPHTLRRASSADTRQVELDGRGQPAALALRVPIELPPGSTVTRRFAFGTASEGQTVEEAVSILRSRSSELRTRAVDKWKNHLVWAAFPGQADSGAIQRELAWSSYYLQAAAGYDRLTQRRTISPAGALRFFYGVDGPAGESAVLAGILSLLDPSLARDVLAFVMSTQHGTESESPGRVPYGSAGIDDYADVLGQNARSDVYVTLPAAIAQYVAASRDVEFFDERVSYWPQAFRTSGSVAEHLQGLLDYVGGSLGRGSRGLLAMGSGDVTDGILDESPNLATPVGSSSTVTAMIAAQTFETLADQLDAAGGDGAGFRDLHDDQAAALADESFGGSYFYRGFDDDGDPLLDDRLFALPQALAVLAGLSVGSASDALFGLVEERLSSPMGTRTDDAEPDDSGLAPVGMVRPLASGWLTQGAARADAERGWTQFVASMAWARAEEVPLLWYQIWSSPDWIAPSGEPAATLSTGYGDEPGGGVHGHAAVIRGLVGVLGISPTASGLRIDPRVPGETFDVVFPTLSIAMTPTSLSGSVLISGSAPMELTLVLPSGLRGGALRVVLDGQPTGTFVRDGDEVRFSLPASDQVRTFSIGPN